MDWLLVGTRWGGSLSATPSGDIATLSVNTLRNSVASLKQHLLAGEQRLMARESVLSCRLFVADEQALKASLLQRRH